MEQYQSEFARKYVSQGREEGRQEGRQEGEAQAVLEVLDARGVQVDPQSRQRIMACREPAQLKSWLRRAVRVQSLQALFESTSPAKARGRRQARKPAPK